MIYSIFFFLNPFAIWIIGTRQSKSQETFYRMQFESKGWAVTELARVMQSHRGNHRALDYLVRKVDGFVLGSFGRDGLGECRVWGSCTEVVEGQILIVSEGATISACNCNDLVSTKRNGMGQVIFISLATAYRHR